MWNGCGVNGYLFGQPYLKKKNCLNFAIFKKKVIVN